MALSPDSGSNDTDNRDGDDDCHKHAVDGDYGGDNTSLHMKSHVSKVFDNEQVESGLSALFFPCWHLLRIREMDEGVLHLGYTWI